MLLLATFAEVTELIRVVIWPVVVLIVFTAVLVTLRDPVRALLHKRALKSFEAGPKGVRAELEKADESGLWSGYSADGVAVEPAEATTPASDADPTGGTGPG